MKSPFYLATAIFVAFAATGAANPSSNQNLPQCSNELAPITGTYFYYSDRPEPVMRRMVVSKETIEFADNYGFETASDTPPEWVNIESFPIESNNDGALIYERFGGYRAFMVYAAENRVYPLRLASLGGAGDIKTLETRISSARERGGEDCVYQAPLFREEGVAPFNSRPDLSTLNRSDAIRLIQARQDHGERIQQAVERADGRVSRSAVMQLAKQLRYLMLVDLGYNPWRWVEGDPLAKFKDDEEIQALLAQTAASR